MCSTPQKHPAAIVAFCAPSGMVETCAACSGVRCIVEELNGLIRRWTMFIMVKALRSPPKRKITWVVGFSLVVDS